MSFDKEKAFFRELGYDENIVEKYFTKDSKSLGLTEEQDEEILSKLNDAFNSCTGTKLCSGYPL